MGMTLSRLRSLSPLGPIFGKELRTTARRKRTYALRFLYLAGLLLLLLFYATLFSQTHSNSVMWRVQRQAELGAWFYMVFAYFNLGAMTLVGPILTSTAINSERLHKTLPVLLMTPISAWQIICGKLFSRLWIALTLIGLSLPALAVVRLLGGVEAEQIVAALCMSVSVVIAGAALGLLLSTLMNRSYAVILLSYGVLGIVYGLIPMLVGTTLFGVLRLQKGPAVEWFLQGFDLTNPFFALATIAFPANMRVPAKLPEWYWCAIVHLGVALMLVLLSVLIVRRMARKEHEGGGRAVPATVNRPATDAAAINQPDSRHAIAQASSRTVSDNPVFWREVRRPLLARRWQAIAMSLFVVGVLVLIYCLMFAADNLADRDAQMVFSCIFCGLLTLLTCVLSGTAIAQEKESDTWTLLLTTPLSGRQVVWGKAAGLLRRLAWPAALIAAHFFLFALGGVLNWTATWVVLWLTFTTNILWVATGLYLSLRLKTVIFAVILNLLGPLVLYLLALVVLGILGGLVAHTEQWMEVVGLYAPYAYMVSAIDSFTQRAAYSYNYYDYASSGFFYRQMIDGQSVWIPVYGRVDVITFLEIVLGVGVAYLALAGALLWHTARRFNRIVGRAVQRRAEPI
ncbi:MAG: ABC transporter permease [Bacillota bacterium]